MLRSFTKSAIVLVSLLSISSINVAAEGPGRTIEVHARRYAFDPAEVSVRKGETVQLSLFTDDVPHSLLVKELGIDEAATKNNPGHITFKPEHAGTFRGLCGRFCGEGHGRMSFTIHVTED